MADLTSQKPIKEGSQDSVTTPAPEKQSPVSVDLSGGITVLTRDVRPPGFIPGSGAVAQTAVTAKFNGRYSFDVWTDQQLSNGNYNEVDLRLGAKVFEGTAGPAKYSVGAGVSRWFYPGGDIKLADDVVLDLGVSAQVAGNNANLLYVYVLPNKSHQEGHRVTLNINRPITFPISAEKEVTVTPEILLAHTTHLYEPGSGFAVIRPGLTISTRLTPNVGAFVGVGYQFPLNDKEQPREELVFGKAGFTFNYGR